MTSPMHGLVVLPAIGEGELPNAFLARTGSYSGMPSLLVASRKLLKRRPVLDGMPSNLEIFHRELGHKYGSLKMLIEDHTLWKLYCNGLPEERFDDQWARLALRLPGPVRLCRPPTLFGMDEHVHLQCPMCEEVALKTYGFTYIHRRLAAPYASVCAVHKLPLRALGEQLRLFEQHCKTEPTSGQLNMAWQLAVRMEYCLETAPGKSQYHKTAVIQKLRETHWLAENGRLRLQPFIDTFADFYQGAFADARLALLCQSQEYINNALRALLRVDHAVFPLWCVLFVWFAEERPCPITNHNLQKKKAEKQPPSSTTQPTHAQLKAALAEHGSVKATAIALNISRRELTGLCRRFNLPVIWRSKKLDAALRAQIKKALETGMSAADVTNRFGISISTLYSEIKAWPDILLPGKRKRVEHLEQYKRDWLRLLQANPGQPETFLRKLNPAAWAFLHNNDRPWLFAQRPNNSLRRPRSKKPYCGELVAKLDSSLTAAANAFSAEGAKPVRKSTYSLRTKVGISEYQLKTLEQKGLVTSHEEHRSEFIGRRVTHAEMNGASSTSPNWYFAKKAGLRVDTIRRHLIKHNEQ